MPYDRRECLGIVGIHPEKRFVPPQHFHRDIQLSQGIHNPLRHFVVDVRVDRQEHCVGDLAGRDTQRHSRPHSELAGRVRGCRHHASFGWVATPTDHHRLSGKVGVTKYFDGSKELVEVDVQDPTHIVHATVGIGPTNPILSPA